MGESPVVRPARADDLDAVVAIQHSEPTFRRSSVSLAVPSVLVDSDVRWSARKGSWIPRGPLS